MINSSDLRIGNLFTSYLPIEGSWIEKQRYKGDIYIVTKDTFQCENFEIFKPIPLTEDILLKCEGVKREWNSSKTHLLYIFEDKISVIKLGTQWSVAIQSDADLPRFIRYVEYLHTFQNVIFALTQKELTVQL